MGHIQSPLFEAASSLPHQWTNITATESRQLPLSKALEESSVVHATLHLAPPTPYITACAESNQQLVVEKLAVIFSSLI